MLATIPGAGMRVLIVDDSRSSLAMIGTITTVTALFPW
jgi:hypothetical protein